MLVFKKPSEEAILILVGPAFEIFSKNHSNNLFLNLCEKHFNWTFIIQATHPILSRNAEALEKMQKLDLKFIKRASACPA